MYNITQNEFSSNFLRFFKTLFWRNFIEIFFIQVLESHFHYQNIATASCLYHKKKKNVHKLLWKFKKVFNQKRPRHASVPYPTVSSFHQEHKWINHIHCTSFQAHKSWHLHLSNQSFISLVPPICISFSALHNFAGLLCVVCRFDSHT